MKASSLLLLPTLVFANGNHEENSHHYTNEVTYVSETIVENTYIQYKAYDRAIAINAAIASLPSISHLKTPHKHSQLSIGAGQYNDSTGLSVGYDHMSDCTTLKVNIGVSGSDRVYGAGIGFSF